MYTSIWIKERAHIARRIRVSRSTREIGQRFNVNFKFYQQQAENDTYQVVKVSLIRSIGNEPFNSNLKNYSFLTHEFIYTWSSA